MAEKNDAQELLNQTLELIKRDIKEIKKMNGKLDHDTAQDLVRYANLLDDLIKQKKTEEEKNKKKLSSMTTEELLLKLKEIQPLGDGKHQKTQV